MGFTLRGRDEELERIGELVAATTRGTGGGAPHRSVRHALTALLDGGLTAVAEIVADRLEGWAEPAPSDARAEKLHDRGDRSADRRARLKEPGARWRVAP